MTKICRTCDKEKAFADFYKKPRHAIYPDSAAGYSHNCIDCDLKARATYVENNPDKARNSDRTQHLWTTYRLTPSDYNAMFTAQEGRCLGCNKHQSEFKRRLAVDHCHTTGKVRGLLCTGCNACIGQAKEDPATLRRLIDYLNTHKPDSAVQSEVVEISTKKVG